MKKIYFSGLIIFILGLRLTAQQVHSDYVDGRLYVKLDIATSKKLALDDPTNIPLNRLQPYTKVFAKYGVTRMHKPYHQAWEDEGLLRVIKLEFTKAAQVENLINELKELPGVVYAEKVPLMRIDATPNDPLYTGATHLSVINAANAWNVFNSTAHGNSTITVAIVDNAVMWNHVDLVANTYTNTGEIANNNTDDDGNGYKDDVNGYDVTDLDNNTIPTNLSMSHGTHCAGIAGARTDNSVGIASIGWNIKIIPVKCQTDLGSTTVVANGYEGIVYAVRAKAKVISCSWGGSGPSQTEQSVINFAWNRGSIIIASAGNNNSNALYYPGAYPNVYCVAATTNTDTKLGISNYGSWVDISAPGDNINSTFPYTTTPNYQSLSGTSMATPLVAGLAGLMLSKSPNMTRMNVLNCISSTAVNIYSVTGNSIYAASSELGAGRIDAFAAMNCAANYSATPPIANFYAFPLYTCPGTTVTLFDSSLYVPTSWNWVFQGGTPATSTLANPVVQWNSAGTYSVSLTVANASGSNTATKLSYVNVAGPLSLPFTEGFQSTPFLPANWSANNIWNDPIYWARYTGVGGFGTSTACAIFDNFTYFVANERDEMRSPKFNFSNVATARLRFDVAYARFDATFSDSLEVKLSTNCGSTWTSIYLKGGTGLATAPDASSMFVPTSTQWRRDSIDISALASGQGNVMFSFINRGRYGQPIYLDNINLFTPTPTVAVSGATTLCSASSGTLTGNVAGASGYTWSLPGSSTPTSSLANPVIVYPTSGTYTVTLSANNGPVIATSSLTLNVIATPDVVVNSPSICAGGSATITATGASGYSLNSVSTGPNFTLAPSSTTIYTLTGENSLCKSNSIFTVHVNSNPTVSVSSQTICPGGTATLLASGASSYSWNTGPTSPSLVISPSATTIYTVSGFNGNCVNTKTAAVTIGSSLSVLLNASQTGVCNGGSAIINASGASNYTWSTGANTASVIVSPSVATSYSVFGTNSNCSGTAAISITISPTPTLFLSASPAATLCPGASATISAFGASTYSWSHGASVGQVVVTPTANTIYTVFGSVSPGCSSSKTIALTTGASSINVAIGVNPISLCAGASATLTASGASSYTWNTGANGNVIVVNPTVSTAYSVNATSGTCNGNAIALISVSPVPVSVISSSSTACGTVCSGAITATTSGSQGPYTYSLSGGNCTVLPCSGLCQGVYTLNTSDAAGCKSTDIFTISSLPGNILASINSTNATCASCPDGALNSSPSGGSGPYTYTWLPGGGNAATASNLLPGCYTLTIADALNCKTSSVACVYFPDGIVSVLSSGQQLLVYPNPANKLVTVNYNGGSFNAMLFNNLGQLIVEKMALKGPLELNTSEFARGVYYLALEVNGQVLHRKLLLE